MEPLIRAMTAWDGLTLCLRIWDGGDLLPPVLCLPGLVRTAGDFDTVVPLFGDGRRVVALDYAGRGGSGRSRDVMRYAPEACLRDVLDVCAALHLHHVTIVGTSFGGLLAMGLAAARPALLRGVVLNDVGPEVGAAGAGFVRDFVALDPALPSLDACVTFLQRRLPPLSLASDNDWRMMAALTYEQAAMGGFIQCGTLRSLACCTIRRRTCGRCSARWRTCRCCWCMARSAQSCCPKRLRRCGHTVLT